MAKFTASVTRPANSTTYTARDVIGTAVTCNMTLLAMTGIPGGGGTIYKVRVICDTNQTTKPTMECWIFNTAPAAVADHAAFAPTDVEMGYLQAVIPLSTGYVGAAGAGAAGNYILVSDVAPFEYQCATGKVDLIACLVITNAFVPVDADVFTVVIDAMPYS